MRNFAALCLVLALLIAHGDARAAQLDIGGEPVDFTPPQGYCELDASAARDAEFIDFMAAAMGPQIRVLATFAECSQLAVWRKGLLTYLRDYGFLTIARADERRRVSDGRATFMRALAREFRRADAEAAAEEARRRSAEAGRDELGRVDHLGVLHSDDNAVYFGVVAEVETPEGRMRDAVEVGAMTLIKGKLLSYLLYGEFAGRQSVQMLLGRQRANMDRLIAAN